MRFRRLVAAGTVWLFCCAAAAEAQVISPAEEVDVSGLAERVEALERARQEEAAAEKSHAAADAAKPTVRITSRLHADYWGFPDVDPAVGLLEDADGDPNDRVLFRRVRLGIEGEIPDNMLYKLEMEFGDPSNPQVKDAYIGWIDLPVLESVYLGNQKRPYGLDNLNSANANVFLERPLAVAGLCQDPRRWGLTSNGVSANERFNWRYGCFLSQDMQNLGVNETSLTEDFQAELAGRLADTFWYDEAADGRYYGHWAIAGRYGSADGTDPVNNTARFQTRPEARTTELWFDTGSIAGAEGYSLLALENVWNWGPLNLTGEALSAWVDRPGLDDVQCYGAYAQVSWVLTGEHHPWDRATGTLEPLRPFENFWLVRTRRGETAAGWGAWEVAVRYSYADFSDEGFFGGEGRQLTLGLQWFWNEYCRVQCNYVFGTIADRFNDNDPAQPRNGDYQMAGVRFIWFL
jgi:phosphate-selective porin OprO/OprP